MGRARSYSVNGWQPLVPVRVSFFGSLLLPHKVTVGGSWSFSTPTSELANGPFSWAVARHSSQPRKGTKASWGIY